MFDLPYHVNFDSISDHLKITDGDGTILMKESYGSSFRRPNLKIGELKLVPSLPAGITSTSNSVKLTFITDDHDGGHDGWNVSWSAVRPGNNIILENLLKNNAQCHRYSHLKSFTFHDWWPLVV